MLFLHVSVLLNKLKVAFVRTTQAHFLTHLATGVKVFGGCETKGSKQTFL